MKAVKTILFVENDPVSLTMYQNRLQREGFYIETAQDGLTALRILSQSTPDLVVLDLMLPRFNGGEVYKIMRSDRRLVAVPVVIFSNAAMSEWPQDLSAGPTRCLPKSDSTFPMLLQAIQEMLAAAPVNDVPVNTENFPPAKPESRNGSTAAAPTSPGANSTSHVSKGRAEFLQSALAEIPKLRELCLAYIKAPAAEASQQYLSTLQQRVLFFHTSASQNGCARIALLSNVFGTLLSEIMAKPSWATTSALQTMAQAVDCLRLLLNSGESAPAQPSPKAKVLAVDDDPVCNHVIVTTLRRANFDPITIESPVSALELLKNSQFDLVLLDVNMPEMTGFQLCEKLRRIPHCKTIPVVFVTAFNNFDNRKQSVLSGGNDFITKPISPLELALKVTIHMLKAQLQRASAPPADTAADAAAAASRDSLPATPTIPIVASISARTRTTEGLAPEPPPTPMSRPADSELIAPPTPTGPCPPRDAQVPFQPSAEVPAPEIAKPEIASTISASALEPTTESHTTDVTQPEAPEPARTTFEPSPANESDVALQLAAAIPAPQLDQSLVASLAPSNAATSTAELTTRDAEIENTLTPAPAEAPAHDEPHPVPTASIPRDMFQPAPADTVSASSLIPSTDSRNEDAERVMAAAAAALAEITSELAVELSTASQPTAPASSLSEQITAEPAVTGAPALTSASTESRTTTPEGEAASKEAPPTAEPITTPAPDGSVQPTASINPVESSNLGESSSLSPTPDSLNAPTPAAAELSAAEVAGASDAASRIGQPEPAAVAENKSQSSDSLTATPLEPSPAEITVHSEMQATPVADTVAFESERAPSSSTSTSASEPVKPATPEPTVQSDSSSTVQAANPSASIAPALSEILSRPIHIRGNETAFEKICIEVAKLIFGENGATELNLRLVRAALERSNIHQMVNGPTDLSC